MVMIVIHHCIVHGLGLSGLSAQFERQLVLSPDQMEIAFGINAFCICAVNCFILISGYFKINVSAKRFINLLLSLIVYTILLAIIPNLIEGNYKGALKACLFLSHSPYWFVIDYLFLMVFAPMLNLGFEIFSKHERRLILIGLILISSYFGFLWGHMANKNGYTILQFITMYCLGREIAISRIRITIPKSTIIYIGVSVFLASIGWICWKTGRHELAWRTTYYNDPLLIISSVGLFMLFSNINFHSKFINILAKSAFGIYLFQSSVVIGSVMYEWLQYNSRSYGNWIFLVIILIALLTVMIAILLDQLRIYILNIMQPLCVELYKKLKYEIYKI